ncbi:hypothetical protein [Spiroplasma endosymbiont of Amphibalanus improvisus]|uniref:hypothetical protein n=1 Tax=Spiroplasma endosymbiont of Amphibalanus improvisus TaxID=3066327 RepID=UPI00313AA0B6
MKKNHKIFMLWIPLILVLGMSVFLIVYFSLSDNEETVDTAQLKQSIDNDGQIWIFGDSNDTPETIESRFIEWFNNKVDSEISDRDVQCNYSTDYTIEGDFSFKSDYSLSYSYMIIKPAKDSSILKGPSIHLYFHIFNGILLNTEDNYVDFNNYNLENNNMYISCFRPDGYFENPLNNQEYLNFNLAVNSTFDDVYAYINSKFTKNTIGFNFNNSDINALDYSLTDLSGNAISIPSQAKDEYVTITPKDNETVEKIFSSSFVENTLPWSLLVHFSWT